MKSTYEKDTNSGSVRYTSNGMPYYTVKNLERNVVIWQGKMSEYCISGYLSEEEIEQMMDSIDLGGN